MNPDNTRENLQYSNSQQCAELYAAARALLDDIRRRYPGEELRCPFMRDLDAAVSKMRPNKD